MAEEGRKTAAMRCGVSPQTACLTAGKDRPLCRGSLTGKAAN